MTVIRPAASATRRWQELASQTDRGYYSRRMSPCEPDLKEYNPGDDFSGTSGPESGSNRDRKLKRAAFVLFTGFLVFAPPGTLIVISLFLIGILGKVGVFILVGLVLIALTGLWLKRKSQHR
jgi:hypothetical protein